MGIILTAAMKSGWCEFVQDRLSKIGIQRATDPERPGMGVSQLIERMSTYRGKEPAGAAQGNLIYGKTWEIAAAELVIANADKRSWGWADPRNLDFLEFWQAFEPAAKFVLVFGSPGDSLCYDLDHHNGGADQQNEVLEAWAIYHEGLLKFYHKYRHKCALIHIDAFTEDDEKFASILEQKFDIELDPTHEEIQFKRSAINGLIAERLSAEMLAEQALFVELNDSADIPQSQRNHRGEHRLPDVFAELKEWSDASQAVPVLASENERLLARISELENSEIEAELQLTELQLKQVQEELRYYFAEYQKLRNMGASSDALNLQTDEVELSSEGFMLDMRTVVDGDGWHNAEAEGRWAGDLSVATLKLPPFAATNAELRIRIVDSMSLRHLEELSIEFNGNRLKGRLSRLCDIGGRLAPLRRLKARLERSEKPVPAEYVAKISASIFAAQGAFNELELHFPAPVSPTALGQSDARKLSVCVQTIKLLKADS